MSRYHPLHHKISQAHIVDTDQFWPPGVLYLGWEKKTDTKMLRCWSLLLLVNALSLVQTKALATNWLAGEKVHEILTFLPSRGEITWLISTADCPQQWAATKTRPCHSDYHHCQCLCLTPPWFHQQLRSDTTEKLSNHSFNCRNIELIETSKFYMKWNDTFFLFNLYNFKIFKRKIQLLKLVETTRGNFKVVCGNQV